MYRRTAAHSSALVFVALLGIAASHSIADDAAQPTAKYEADWTQTTFNLSRMNPARDNGRQSNQQAATVNLQLDIADLGNVIGFGRSDLTITKMLDGSGQDVLSLHVPRRSTSRSFEPPGYQTRHDPNSPRPIEDLSPMRFSVSLNAAGPLPEQIASLEGFVPVLVADSTDHVDIPFKVSDQPTEIVPGLRLKFTKAEGKANSYSYSLMPDDRGLPQNDRYDFDGTIRENQQLPRRVVIDRYLIDDEGNRLENRSRRSFSHAGGMNASGSGGADYSKATGMRFEIAVNVSEARLPVSIRNIDLPSVQTANKLLPQQPASPRDLLPIDRMEEALGRHLKRQRDAGERIKWTDAKDAKVRELWDAFKKNHDLGVAASVEPIEVKGVKPDVTNYESYLGIYEGVAEGQRRPVTVTVRKDELGRLLVDTPEGACPAIAKGGALFVVFDDVMIAKEKPLDPDSPPKLAGFWIVQSKGATRLINDTDRPQPELTLQRAAAKAAATQPSK